MALQETVIADGKVSGQEIKMARKHQAGRQWMGLCYGYRVDIYCGLQVTG